MTSRIYEQEDIGTEEAIALLADTDAKDHDSVLQATAILSALADAPEEDEMAADFIAFVCDYISAAASDYFTEEAEESDEDSEEASSEEETD